MSFGAKSWRSSLLMLAALVALLVSVAGAQVPATKILWVAHYRAECVGVGPQKCLLVKEEQYSPWQLFYGQIEGFDYVEGYGYELRVSEEKTADQPADDLAIRVKLVEVINRYDSMNPPAEPSPSSVLQLGKPTIRGVLSSGLGPETRAFRPCGAREEIWVVDKTSAGLWQRYRQLAGAPNRPLYVEVQGGLEPAPNEGFGAHYAQQLVVTQVVRASPGTKGCDDD